MYLRKASWFIALAAAAAALSAQAPAGSTREPAVSTPPTTTGPATAADLLQPALSNARSELRSLKLEKWKKGSVRDEAEANVASLLGDLDNNIQPLISAADAAPGQLSKAIPLVKHLDAFYDVLLRVEEASRIAAPGEQISALQSALLRVSQSRIAYDDVLQAQAANSEKQLADLQTALRAEQTDAKDLQHRMEVAKTAPSPCKPAPAHRKRRTAAKKASTPESQNPTPAAPQQKKTQ